MVELRIVAVSGFPPAKRTPARAGVGAAVQRVPGDRRAGDRRVDVFRSDPAALDAVPGLDSRGGVAQERGIGDRRGAPDMAEAATGDHVNMPRPFGDRRDVVLNEGAHIVRPPLRRDAAADPGPVAVDPRAPSHQESVMMRCPQRGMPPPDPPAWLLRITLLMIVRGLPFDCCWIPPPDVVGDEVRFPPWIVTVSSVTGPPAGISRHAIGAARPDLVLGVRSGRPGSPSMIRPARPQGWRTRQGRPTR